MTHAALPALLTPEHALTTVLRHDLGAPASNCLAQAVRTARDGVDEVVFIGAPAGSAQPGHVVLLDTQTRAVREPDEDPDQGRLMAAEDYAAARAQRVLCAVPAALLHSIVALPRPMRPAALACLGGPLPSIAHLAFGIVAPVMPHTPSQGGGDKPPPTGASAQDKNVHAWLDALGDSVSDNDKKALAQTGDDSTTLLNWFDAHKRGDPKLNDMPKNVADAENRLLSNDAVAKQFTVDGKVTRDAIGGFLKNLDSGADSAKSSFQSFKDDNKTPDPVSKQQAADASILQANTAVLDAAGSKKAKVDQKVDVNDLKAVASNSSDAKLPDALKNAAAFYSNPGEFSMLSNAGLDASAKSDGTVQNSNLDAFVSKSTSKTEDDTISGLKSAAVQQAVSDAGGDASNVNKDFFTGGKSDASGADKAAAMVQLSQTIGRLNAGESQYQQSSPADLSSPDQYHQYYDGPTPGEQRSDFIKDVQSKIDTLGKDKDVQSFLSDKEPGALQGIVSSDPALKAAVQKQYDASSSTKALTDAFGQNDSKGKPLSTTDTLGSFISKPNFYAQALNTTPDLTKALDGAPKDIKDKVKQGYDDITSGKEIADLTKQGTKQDEAIIKSATNKTVYDSVLDKQTVQDGTDKFNDATAKLGRDQLTDGKSGDDLLKGLGATGLDDPKLLKLIADNKDKLAPDTKNQPSDSGIILGVRYIVDTMRHGTKFDDAVAKYTDALNKLTKNGDNAASIFPNMTALNEQDPKFAGELQKWKSSLPSQVTDTYKQGLMHATSGLLLGGSIIAGYATGTNGSPAQTTAQALSAAGLLTEGGAKYYSTTLVGLKSSVDTNKNDFQSLKDMLDQGKTLSPDQLKQYGQFKAESDSFNNLTNSSKDVENVGKTMGGVAGNALGLALGAIGAKDSAAKGDIGGAAAQGIFAGLNGISSIAGGTEVAAYVLPRIGAVAADSALAATIGAAAGAIGGAVGGIAAIGGLIYGIVSSIKADEKKSQDENTWYKELQTGFAPSGVALPEEGVLLDPANGAVPDGPANNPAA